MIGGSEMRCAVCVVCEAACCVTSEGPGIWYCLGKSFCCESLISRWRFSCCIVGGVVAEGGYASMQRSVVLSAVKDGGWVKLRGVS